MTNLPSPGSDPGSNSNRRSRSRLLRRIGLPLGVALLAGVAGGAWYGWFFVNERLAPLIEANLSQSLRRPVQLGGVERVSLTSLRFGRSSVPPTATDPDRVTIEAVDVAFNPIQLLLTRNLNLDITLDKPNLYLEQARDGSWIAVQISDEERQGPVKTEFQAIRFKDARATLVPIAKAGGGKAAPINLSQLNGSANFFDQNQRIAYELAGQSNTGGSLKLNGETLRSPSRTNLQVQGQNFALAEIDRLVKFPVNLPAGRANGNVSVEFRPNQKQPYVMGTATFTGTTLAIPKVPYTFTQAKGTLQLVGRLLTLENTTAFFGKGKIPLLANGTLDFDKGFNLAAKVKPISLARLVQTFQLKLPVPVSGEVLADLKVTGKTQQPVITGVARNTKPGRVDRIDLSKYSAQFQLSTATLALAIPDIQASPAAGGQVTGAGRVSLRDPVQLAFSLQARDVPAEPIASAYSNGRALPIAIGRVSAQAVVTGTTANPRTAIRWQAPEAEYAGTGEIIIANGITTLQNTNLAIAGSSVSAQARAQGGRWQALVAGSQIQLNRFSQDLRGFFSGAIALSGSLSDFSPASVRAQGQGRLSQGISVIAAPIDAQFGWDGQKVLLQRATAPGFSANGAIFARLTGRPAVTGLDLNVRTSNYSLQAIALPVPRNIDYSGRVDFAGRLVGSPASPNINGGLTLRQFVLNGTAFESPLRGSLRVAQGVNLNLTGQRDRIALTLGSDYQIVAFDIKRDQAIATGRTQGDLLLVDAKNFPLSFLNTSATAVFFPLGGELNGTVALSRSRLRTGDLSQLNANGQLTITNPAIGTYRASQFGGRISLNNGVATLSGAELRRGQSIFQLDASANIASANPQFKTKLTVAQGQLQDVLELLQLFDLSDLARGADSPAYGTAADLQTVPVELSRTALLNRIRRIAEIQTLQAQAQATREASPLPELSELKGAFSGEVTATGSLRTGINAQFNLSGQDWQWGSDLSAKQVVASGTFENGVLTLLPLRFQSDDSLVAFSGQVGGATQSGQFRMENIPVDRVTELLNLPLDVQGNLNATATISGSQSNPQVIGLLSLANGVLNGTDVQEAQGNFGYSNARLNFGSRLLISGTEPVTLTGSVPQKLPFASVEPDNDQIQLSINVKDEGLALLNLLNNQVAWVDGAGQVNVEVQGTLQQPIATGTASFEKATLQARALPEPLTNVTGTIRFDRDRLRVDKVTGQFTRGEVTAAGVLPIFATLSPNDPDQQTPLNVSLDQVSLNLKGLYQGGVGGDVQVTGTALSPVIGGTIQLSNGQVLLASSEGTEATNNDGATTNGNATSGNATSRNAASGDNATVIAFNNLLISLGDRVRVVSAPLLSFVATGDLTINGTLDELKPKGLISLRSGQVNLFTTQFTLARGYPQTAEFVENQGLDPNLNVRLITSVAEVTSSRLPTSTLSSEINDSTITASAYGSLQTVRVQAQVEGPASRLSDNLTLTSSPARSETEIVSLLGAGFVNTLGRGDTALGIANLAGSALLSNIQGVIGNALGLSEFRLFPTVTRPDRARGSSRGTSALGLGAEAAIDITPSFSLSALKVLTSNEPTQFGIRYRLNDQILLRGSSDFSGDSRALVEYEARF
ncbi:translocation/assembly module TamB [Leptolyngbya sp. FACHB-321]|uniref:translocation/assembly module TamB domain-containing protein n=1 Tax=Leptolyngbya sp. FACHB-321 TaxID=2692807 RepID=UPI00168A00D4|nr:translocation/assembly module TamB [Leptolyngbya sp. FACHB-321]